MKFRFVNRPSCLWAFIFFSIILCCNHAIASDVTVKAEVDNAFITIGDRIEFKITVSHPKAVDVISIDATQALSDFEIKKIKDFKYSEKGLVYEGKSYTITNFDLGAYVIRPATIYYRLESGETATVESNELYVTVQSVDENRDPDSDIRGLKGVVSL